MSVLDDIVATKRGEVAALTPHAATLEADARSAAPARDFAAALRAAPGMAVIAEIKRRSPSKGDLAPDLDPAATARAYEAGGASCLSVLTDGPYFGGDWADLTAARSACRLPVLRKDFTIDPVQIFEARAGGADAVLLIAAALPDDGLLRDLHAVARGVGLSVLVEVHDAAELDRALAIDGHIIGVNARDLGTFAEDLSTGEQLVRRVPAGTTAVAESAIRSVADVERMAAAGFDAVLVGEALVLADDPTTLVCRFAAVPRSGR
jgi:indole-3-glycerol phosphate synthase